MSHEKTQALLELTGVDLVYRARPALRAIDLRIDPGQQWACLGPNGAGKTSLARVISRQARHYSGTQTRSPLLEQHGVAYVCFEQARALCERDRKLDDSEFRPDAMDPGTTVQELILNGASPCEGFRRWVTRLALEPVLKRGLRFISTGEMRKTLLIKALLARPGLLILDNPMDGLDVATQRELWQVIDELLNSEMPVLLLCRQLEDIPEGVSHILVLEDGHVRASGLRREVLDKPLIDELLNPPPKPLTQLPPPAPRNYELPAKGPLVELRGVDVSYGDHQVLSKVSWRFDRGQHCCVSGPNGCGKTTLLSLITGDNHKAYGQDITLFGIRRGSGESIWDIKQKYGQLDTQLHLSFARGMKVLDVVVSGFFDTIGLYDDYGDRQRAYAERWLSSLGLADYERDSFDTLSFGLQRMVLLARAMVKSPVILLLDEPTLGLDTYHRKLILGAIDHIAQNCDTQVIFVSHSVGEMPDCINQQLVFIPSEQGFEVVCR